MLLIFIVPPPFFAVLPLLIPVKLYEAILAPRFDENLLQYRHLHDLSLAQFHSPICCELFSFCSKLQLSTSAVIFLWDYWIQNPNYHAGDDGSGAVVVGDD